jgi:hypothetical protein
MIKATGSVMSFKSRAALLYLRLFYFRTYYPNSYGRRAWEKVRPIAKTGHGIGVAGVAAPGLERSTLVAAKDRSR